MPTPNSSATAYCTPAQLLSYHDARQVGDAIADNLTRVPPANITTDPNVLEALSWASGMVESACFVANRYTPADLAALNNQGAALLRGLVADLAFFKLKERRAASAGTKIEPAASDQLAFKMLDDIQDGKRIFGLLEKANAGNPSVDFMTLGNFQTDQLSTGQAERFFGQRADVARTGSGTGLPSG